MSETRSSFIGGTALARTHLPAGRLSEDIDLIAIGERKPVAAALDEALSRALARSHGRLTIEPPLGSVARGAVSAINDGLQFGAAAVAVAKVQ